MNMIEKMARAMCDRVNGQGDYEANPCRRTGWGAQARAAVEVMREPDPAMIRAALVDTELTEEQLDFGAEVMAGMPPARPELQRKGIEAAADLYRDWQAMINTALNEQYGGDRG